MIVWEDEGAVSEPWFAVYELGRGDESLGLIAYFSSEMSIPTHVQVSNWNEYGVRVTLKVPTMWILRTANGNGALVIEGSIETE